MNSANLTILNKHVEIIPEKRRVKSHLLSSAQETLLELERIFHNRSEKTLNDFKKAIKDDEKPTDKSE